MTTGRGRDELQVVHDDHAELLAAQDAAGLGANLRHRGAGGVVDDDVQLGELLGRFQNLRPLLGADVAGADLLQADAGIGCQQALRDLRLGHLQREERHGRASKSRVCCEVEREGRLTHARSGADDHHLARSQSKQAAVDGREARLDAQGLVLALGRGLQLLVEVGHDVLEGLLVGVHVAVGDIQQHLLGAVDDFLGVLGRVVGKGRDLRGRQNHLAQRGVAVEHLHVAAPAEKGKRVVGKAQQVGAAANLLQLAGALEVVGKGDAVHRLVAVKHLAHGQEDGLVGRKVEVIRRQLDEALLKRVRRDHHRGEHRRFRLAVLWHDARLRDGHSRRVDVVVVGRHGLSSVDQILATSYFSSTYAAKGLSPVASPI